MSYEKVLNTTDINSKEFDTGRLSKIIDDLIKKDPSIVIKQIPNEDINLLSKSETESISKSNEENNISCLALTVKENKGSYLIRAFKLSFKVAYTFFLKLGKIFS